MVIVRNFNRLLVSPLVVVLNIYYEHVSVRRTMKRLVLLATAAAVLVSVPAVGSAANIKSKALNCLKVLLCIRIILKRYLLEMLKRI